MQKQTLVASHKELNRDKLDKPFREMRKAQQEKKAESKWNEFIRIHFTEVLNPRKKKWFEVKKKKEINEFNGGGMAFGTKKLPLNYNPSAKTKDLLKAIKDKKQWI